MKKIIIILLGVTLLCSGVYADEKQQNRDVGLSLKEINLSLFELNIDNGGLSRTKEFTYFPSSNISLSKLRLNYIPVNVKEDIYLNFVGSKLFEQDSKTVIDFSSGNLASGKISYVKTPHYIDISNNTQRSKSNLKFNILPLKNINFTIGMSEEDKIGNLSSNEIVGQKNREKEISSTLDLKSFIVEMGYKNDEFRERDFEHNINNINLSIQNTTKDKYAISAVYNKNELSNDSLVVNSNKDLENVTLSAIYPITEDLLISTSWANEKLESNNIDNFASDKQQLNIGIEYELKNNSFELEYNRLDNDLKGTEIEKQVIDNYKFTARTRLPKVSAKIEFNQELRGAQGIQNTDLQNMEEVPCDTKNIGFTLTSNHLKNSILTYYVNDEKKDYDRISSYGIDEIENYLQGFYASYILPKITLSYNYLILEWNVDGYRKYLIGNYTPVAYSIYQNNESHNISLDFTVSEKANIGLSYTQSESESRELFNTNDIEEKTFIISGNYNINSETEILFNVNINKFDEKLTNPFSDSNLFKIEIKKKF